MLSMIIKKCLLLFFQLKKELTNFGPDFFEEIEDLKYNYKQALEKNILYEEKLQQMGAR